MKRIIGIFTAFLLPALPAFGASSATQNKVLSINGGAKVSDGKDNITLRVTVKSPNACKIKGSSLHTANSDLVHTIECPSTATSLTLQYSIDDQKQAFAYNIENPTQTIKLNKARSGYNLPEKIQITKKQATSKQKTTTAAPADEDFDFVAAQKRDRAAYETDYEAEPYGTTTTTAKPKSTIRAGDDDELQRVGEIHAADAEADAERSQPKQTKQTKKQEPDFDFAAASANDMDATVARSGLGNTLAPEPTTPEKSERQKQIEENTKKSLTVQPKPEKKKIAQTANEKSRLTRTAIDKFCKDDGYVYKKNAIETPSIGYVQDLCNSESKVKFVCYNFKGASIPTQEIIKHFANYCYTNTTNSCESIKESRPSDHYNKKDAQRAEKQEQNKIGKRCEIANAKSAKYTEKPSGAIVCEPDECVCGYDIVVKESNKYTCQKWTKAPSCLSQDLDTNATKGHYECKNNKKVCVIDECDYKAHYLNSAKNKCIAKSTVKCGNDEIVNNAGKCQKNIKVGPMNNSDLEMTQDDINRDNCIRGQDKKHTKWENNKCVCENADYEMQSDGYCTLKRAKCLKQRNTKYENGRCVCTSADFEMGADNNCTMTDAASVTADKEAAEIAFACSESGGTMNDQGKCECGKGYKPDGQGACEPNKRTLSNEEKKILCEKEGAGTWTSKNKCECTNKTHSFDDEVGCTENKNKVKRAEKETANNHKKELCTEPNKWNDTLKKCTCKDKKQFFDEETGCVSATADFLAAETELNTLKQQFETKKAELASAN